MKELLPIHARATREGEIEEILLEVRIADPVLADQSRFRDGGFCVIECLEVLVVRVRIASEWTVEYSAHTVLGAHVRLCGGFLFRSAIVTDDRKTWSREWT